MTDREKLIALVHDARINALWHNAPKPSEYITDMLISNGVVVREKGEWMKVKEPLGWQEVDCVECPNCHESWVIDEDYCFEDLGFWNFCPNCGADMRKGENDGV